MLSVRAILELVVTLAGLASLTTSRVVNAQAAAEPPAATPGPANHDVETARTSYLEGLRLVREAQWAEALTAFERSQLLRPHPMTAYNIGACERALGRYTRARERLNTALRTNTAGELPLSVVSDAQAFVAEIERLLVHITLELIPAGTGISIDGRPLVQTAQLELARPVLLAGIALPGVGETAPTGRFVVVADPGAHVMTFSRKGYADVVINKTFAPGQRFEQRLELTRLPATIHVSSNERNALVSVNDRDVGPAPVDVLRSAGTYRVVVTKPGFVRYRTDVHVQPGEQAALRVALVREKASITRQWWFWTAAAAVVGGVATSTFLLTRDERQPQRPPLDGGSLDWVAPIP